MHETVDEVDIGIVCCHNHIPLLLQNVKCLNNEFLLSWSLSGSRQEVEQGPIQAFVQNADRYLPMTWTSLQRLTSVQTCSVNTGMSRIKTIIRCRWNQKINSPQISVQPWRPRGSLVPPQTCQNRVFPLVFYWRMPHCQPKQQLFLPAWTWMDLRRILLGHVSCIKAPLNLAYYI